MIGLYLVLVGLGAGSFFSVQIAAQNALPWEQLGVGTGVIRYCMQLGQPLGAALIGIVVNSALAGSTGAGLPTTSVARLQLSGVLQNGFWVVLVLSMIALMTTFLLKDAPMTHQAREAVGQESRQPPCEAITIRIRWDPLSCKLACRRKEGVSKPVSKTTSQISGMR